MRASCLLVFARHYGFYIAALGQTGGVFLRALMYMCMQGMGKKTPSVLPSVNTSLVKMIFVLGF